MKSVIDHVQAVIEWTIGLLLAAMVLLVFGNAAGRYILNAGVAASEELARLGFVWLIFLGAVLAVRERTHVGVDMMVKLLPRGVQRLCLAGCNLLILYALWLFAKGSWQQVLVGLNSELPVTGISLAAFAAAGLFASVAMALLFLTDLVRLVLGRMSDEELIQVKESADEEIVEQERQLTLKAEPASAGKVP
ncbi:MAG: tripartite ATP-independent periplasmic transporter, DctQ component family protein [Xanthobacteraceae bacterium]|jgi:TRAP-type C4-dicarboxylate transport system permease small subunit|nr:tripartite ATP-independent periplasmic transporter, DctQ component family protein [Xanthobacteraceae bacterium]